MLSELRRRAGNLRDRLLHGRENARLARAAAEAEEGWASDALDALPPLPGPAAARLEVHTLCGERQAVMGMWSTWSVLRFLPGARLVVHDDGSLGAATAARWRRLAPGMRVASKAEGAAAAAAWLERFPRLLRWSRDYHFGAKIGAYYALAEAPAVLELDTDTLTFAPPAALLEASGRAPPPILWNRDETSCYAYPEAVLREVLGPLLGPTLPPRLNAGYMLAPRLDDEALALMEAALERFERDPRTDPLRYWMHQTLWAILASRREGAAGPLPAGYDVHRGPTRDGAVMRHYVGHPNVRPRFFTEGVRRVVEDMRRRGQVGAGAAAAAPA